MFGRHVIFEGSLAKIFVFELQSFMFEGSLAVKLRFWASKLHFWRKSRRKASLESADHQIIWISNQLITKSLEFQISWQPNHLNLKITWLSNQLTTNHLNLRSNDTHKSLVSQISWQPNHLDLKSVENQISWISNQLTTKSFGFRTNWHPHTSSYRCVIFGNFRHRLAR